MSMAIKYAMKKKMAKGGDVKGVHTAWSENVKDHSAGRSWAGQHVRGANMAKEAGQKKAEPARKQGAKNEHHRVLGEMREMRDKDRTNLAEGGCVSCADGTCMEHGGMVDRIMRKRMAKGGEVTADELPNEFDEQELEPAEEFSYTGANSGDELGNDEMDENDRDLISRIMRSRAKKDRMPRPA